MTYTQRQIDKLNYDEINTILINLDYSEDRDSFLQKLIKHKQEKVRFLAVESVYEGDSPVLMAAARDKSEIVRKEAIRQIEEEFCWGDDENVDSYFCDVLNVLSSDKNHEIATTAKNVLDQLKYTNVLGISDSMSSIEQSLETIEEGFDTLEKSASVQQLQAEFDDIDLYCIADDQTYPARIVEILEHKNANKSLFEYAYNQLHEANVDIAYHIPLTQTFANSKFLSDEMRKDLFLKLCAYDPIMYKDLLSKNINVLPPKAKEYFEKSNKMFNRTFAPYLNKSNSDNSDDFIGALTESATETTKNVAVNMANKALVKSITDSLTKNKVIPKALANNEYLVKALMIVAPSILLYAANSQEQLINEKFGKDASNRIKSLATAAIKEASKESIEPIINAIVPQVKALVEDAQSPLKQLKEARF